jgi:hypothetical protein
MLAATGLHGVKFGKLKVVKDLAGSDVFLNVFKLRIGGKTT